MEWNATDIAISRLERDRTIWLATVRPDGRPHLVPVWFVHQRGTFWIATGAASVKVRNLRHRAEAMVALQDGEAPIVAATDAELVARPFPADVVAAFAAKYGWDVTVDDDPDVGEVAIVRLDVRRWSMRPTGLG